MLYILMLLTKNTIIQNFQGLLSVKRMAILSDIYIGQCSEKGPHDRTQKIT